MEHDYKNAITDYDKAAGLSDADFIPVYKYRNDAIKAMKR